MKEEAISVSEVGNRRHITKVRHIAKVRHCKVRHIIKVRHIVVGEMRHGEYLNLEVHSLRKQEEVQHCTQQARTNHIAYPSSHFVCLNVDDSNLQKMATTCLTRQLLQATICSACYGTTLVSLELFFKQCLKLGSNLLQMRLQNEF